MPAIGTCYGAAPSAGIPGNLIVELELDEDGLPTRLEIPSSTFDDPDLNACILGIFRDITYPAPPNQQTLTLRYPLAFAPN